jgi:HAD superfamily phosphatase (TIGR01668 family)
MFKVFTPKLQHNTLFEIDLSALKKHGIKGIIIDFKNTLTGQETISQQIKNWLNKVRDEHHMKVVILSNSNVAHEDHVKSLNGIPAIFSQNKPNKKSFHKALNLLGTKPSETAVIGNGFFSDVRGGNRLGMYTIFVSPPYTRPRILRFVKRLLLKIFNNKQKGTIT